MKTSRFPLLALNSLLNKLENDSCTDLENVTASKHGAQHDACVAHFDSSKCLRVEEGTSKGD